MYPDLLAGMIVSRATFVILIVAIPTWLLLSIAVGFYGRRQGYRAITCYLGALIVSPAVAFALLAALGPRRDEHREARDAWIIAGSVVLLLMILAYSMPVDSSMAAHPVLWTLAALGGIMAVSICALGAWGAAGPDRVPCSYCAERILPAALVCPFCRSDLTPPAENPTFAERMGR